MTMHPALTLRRVAVITGAASGIGLAAAERLARLGMRICMADISDDLQHAADRVAKLARVPTDVMAVPTDVYRIEQVMALRDRVYGEFGEVALLMNNAGTEGGGGLSGDPKRWRQILEVNLWGVINGIQTFVPEMQSQETPCAVVNTGSKQGITCPPGDTAYNVSKAGIKVVTEALAHDLRQGGEITAHLLIPGFTYTGFTNAATKPDAAWTAAQVVEFMLDGMAAGDFYLLCPDNVVTREVDALRIAWAAGDIIENRPPLSRWHPDYAGQFAEFLEAGLKKG